MSSSSQFMSIPEHAWAEPSAQFFSLVIPWKCLHIFQFSFYKLYITLQRKNLKPNMVLVKPRFT
jgi:hypothetical protein